MGYALDMQASCRHQSNGTYTVTLEISGVPSIVKANEISSWLRRTLRPHISEIGGKMMREGDGAIPRDS